MFVFLLPPREGEVGWVVSVKGHGCLSVMKELKNVAKCYFQRFVIFFGENLWVPRPHPRGVGAQEVGGRGGGTRFP